MWGFYYPSNDKLLFEVKNNLFHFGKCNRFQMISVKITENTKIEITKEQFSFPSKFAISGVEAATCKINVKTSSRVGTKIFYKEKDN